MTELKQIRIAITGPESTGKSTLARQLSEAFGGLFIPEYARDYVAQLPGHYEFTDIENIARKQIEQYVQASQTSTEIVFFDTWLIITKVWFNWVYGKVPSWLEAAIRDCPIDLYLLCRPDLPWEADDVRENGGENRIKLFNRYKEELIGYGFGFVEISGLESARLSNAANVVREFCANI
jgi:NadR type nicotinamide-nucleotide adenylyltransferase